MSVESVVVDFSGVRAVDGVSLRVGAGERVAVLGASGSGKSTLLRAIAGIDDLSSGAVLWNGADLADVPPYRRGFALMFQDGQLFRHRTVAGNVGYALEVRGVPRGERTSIVADLLRLVGLDDYADRAVRTLSGGQAQRVALARSLAASPRLLLLDEPLSALDRELRDRLGAELARILDDRGVATVLVTHDEAEAATIAHRTVRMAHGRLATPTTPVQNSGDPAQNSPAGPNRPDTEARRPEFPSGTPES